MIRNGGDFLTHPAVLCDYNPAWAEEFLADKNRILAAIGSRVRRIKHVGSTSIPGMPAKRIIDIAVAVDDLSLVDNEVSPDWPTLATNTYRSGNFPTEDSSRRGPWGAGTYHLHVYELQSEDWVNYPALSRLLGQTSGGSAGVQEAEGRVGECGAGQADVHGQKGAVYPVGARGGADGEDPSGIVM
ncbi:GrpB family protein [Alicyclobacillus kakegawensis]|uniref:GrpB family protein n=1 Tax=Alicyclobacillus kakegawensis TaxID=392012 RepID=UPI000832CE7B|nr:GrpB family protein [Alicyclobacillus kakegawensis]